MLDVTHTLTFATPPPPKKFHSMIGRKKRKLNEAALVIGRGAQVASKSEAEGRSPEFSLGTFGRRLGPKFTQQMAPRGGKFKFTKPSAPF